MAINPASLFDLPGDPLLDKLKRALSQLHERTEVVEAAASALQAGQVQAVDDLVQQITTNFSELFTDGSVVVQALQEGRYTSADIDGPVVFSVQNGLALTLDVSGPIGFSPAPIVMIGHKASTDDFALARVVSWNRETNTLVVDMLTWVGETGPHSDCYVEVGLLSALAELAMLEEVQTLLGSTQNARDAAAGYRDQAAGHVTSAAGEKDQAIAARNLAQGYATTASGARDTALGYRDQAAASAALAAASAGQIIDVLDRVDVLPTLNLDLADINGAPFKGNLTRATNGGYRLNSKGILVPTAVNEPVIDYGSDGKPKGTGFFGAYTNLLLRSEEFEDAYWLKANASVTPNDTIDPAGAMSADKLISSINGGSNTAFVERNVAASAITTYTFSVFLKKGTSPKSVVNFYRSPPYAAVALNITWGSTPTMVIDNGHGILLSSKLEILPNDWVRVSATIGSAAATTLICRVYVRGSGTDNVAGEYIYVWGAQLTQTAFPVPYVPTTSAAVVRNADSFVIGGSDFTDFFNPLEGTFFMDATCQIGGASWPWYFTVNDGTMSNCLGLFRSSSDGLAVLRGRVGGAMEINAPPGIIAAGTQFRMAASYRANEFRASLNGAAVAADLAGTVPVVNRLLIGSGDEPANTTIRRLIYWPKALSATDLQRLSA